jgi:hypothetical protein
MDGIFLAEAVGSGVDGVSLSRIVELVEDLVEIVST